MAVIETFDGTHFIRPGLQVIYITLKDIFPGRLFTNLPNRSAHFRNNRSRVAAYTPVCKTNQMAETIRNKMEHPQNNAALASLFHRMADCYRFLGTEERFRSIAYENVAKILFNMKEDIAVHAADKKSLDEIKGIGESIAEKIMEYLRTGKISTFERLKKQVPYRLLELMDITGFGPATLKELHEQLHINNREDLVLALEKGKLAGLKGFGEKKIANLKRALKLETEKKRMPLKEAGKIGNGILAEIKLIPGVQQADLAGSLRRKKETIGDIDILVLAEPRFRKKIVSRIINLPQVENVLAKGTTRASVLLKHQDIQVDIRLVRGYEYGAALLYFTCAKEPNIQTRNTPQ